MEAKYNLDLILFQVKWIKTTQYSKWSFKSHLRKTSNSTPSQCVSSENGVGAKDQKLKTWHNIFLIIDRLPIFSKFGVYP